MYLFALNLLLFCIKNDDKKELISSIDSKIVEENLENEIASSNQSSENDKNENQNILICNVDDKTVEENLKNEIAENDESGKFNESNRKNSILQAIMADENLNKNQQKELFIKFLKSNERIKVLLTKYKINSFEECVKIIDAIVYFRMRAQDSKGSIMDQLKDQWGMARDLKTTIHTTASATIDLHNIGNLLKIYNLSAYHFYEICKEVDSIIEESLKVYVEYLLVKEKYDILLSNAEMFEKDFEYSDALIKCQRITENQFKLSKLEYRKFQIELLEIESQMQQLNNLLNILFINKEYEQFNLNDILSLILDVKSNNCSSLLEAEKQKYILSGQRVGLSFLKYLPNIVISSDMENLNYLNRDRVSIEKTYSLSTLLEPANALAANYIQYKNLQFLAKKSQADNENYQLKYELLIQQSLLYQDQIECRVQELNIMQEKFQNSSNISYEKISQHNREIMQYKLRLKDLELEKYKILLKILNEQGYFKQLFVDVYN